MCVCLLVCVGLFFGLRKQVKQGGRREREKREEKKGEGREEEEEDEREGTG